MCNCIHGYVAKKLSSALLPAVGPHPGDILTPSTETTERRDLHHAVRSSSSPGSYLVSDADAGDTYDSSTAPHEAVGGGVLVMLKSQWSPASIGSSIHGPALPGPVPHDTDPSSVSETNDIVSGPFSIE